MEGGRTQQATLFGSDLYELLYLTGRRDPIHGLLSAVEDIVVAGDRLLKRNRLTEEADDIRRQPTGRPDHSCIAAILSDDTRGGGHDRDETECRGEPLGRRGARRGHGGETRFAKDNIGLD